MSLVAGRTWPVVGYRHYIITSRRGRLVVGSLRRVSVDPQIHVGIQTKTLNSSCLYWELVRLPLCNSQLHPAYHLTPHPRIHDPFITLAVVSALTFHRKGPASRIKTNRGARVKFTSEGRIDAPPILKYPITPLGPSSLPVLIEAESCRLDSSDTDAEN